jgi:hypothetical protein
MNTRRRRRNDSSRSRVYAGLKLKGGRQGKGLIKPDVEWHASNTPIQLFSSQILVC